MTKEQLLPVIYRVMDKLMNLGVSAGTTIGYDADHYKNIIVRPMAYGQSLALIALVEALG